MADIIRQVDPPRRWHVVMPVKGGPEAKSRLGRPWTDRRRLALAMAMDCLCAVLATPGVQRAVVVTDDERAADEARGLGAVVVAPTGAEAGLNAAVADGLATCPAGAAGAVLLADVPAMRPADLRAGLDAVEHALPAGGGWIVVPDAEGTGTVLSAADPWERLVPAFGPGSAAAHEILGALRVDGVPPRLRRDVDTSQDLDAAVALGVGPRTRRTLLAVQATVIGYDAATRSGAVVTDDGIRLAMPAEALEGSGFRHLRPGQRVTCVRDGDAVADVHLVGIRG